MTTCPETTAEPVNENIAKNQRILPIVKNTQNKCYENSLIITAVASERKFRFCISALRPDTSFEKGRPRMAVTICFVHLFR